MNGAEVRALFQDIVRRAFNVDHEAYLRQSGKSFWGVGIDRSSKRLTPLFGTSTDAIRHLRYSDSRAGYSVGMSDKPQGPETDVLLVATELLDDCADAALRDALLLHEACHFVIDAGLGVLPTNVQDAASAASFKGRLHPEDSLHDEAFLRALSAAARAFAGDAASHALVGRGMQFDALPEHTEGVECEDEE